MRDFLRKKRKTTEEQPEQDVAVDTAGVRTPSETAPRIKRRRRWYLRFARQQLAGEQPRSRALSGPSLAQADPCRAQDGARS